MIIFSVLYKYGINSMMGEIGIKIEKNCFKIWIPTDVFKMFIIISFFIRFVWKGVEDGKIKMLVQVK